MLFELFPIWWIACDALGWFSLFLNCIFNLEISYLQLFWPLVELKYFGIVHFSRLLIEQFDKSEYMSTI